MSVTPIDKSRLRDRLWARGHGEDLFCWCKPRMAESFPGQCIGMVHTLSVREELRIRLRMWRHGFRSPFAEPIPWRDDYQDDL